MSNMSNIIEEIKELWERFTGKNPQPINRGINKVIAEELTTHFKQFMDAETVDNRILYPMSFNILMHESDYNRAKESVPFILPTIISKFYSLIKTQVAEKEKTYGTVVDSSNPATYWFFQFSACKFAEHNDITKFLEKGAPITICKLTTLDIKKIIKEESENDQDVGLSIKVPQSNVIRNNINMDALHGIDILGDGTFSYYFDKNMSQDLNTIKTFSTNTTFKAQLRWPLSPTPWFMLDNYIEITGGTDNRNLRHICRIENNAICVPHVAIRYEPQTQTFELAAWAKTRINERNVPLSDKSSPIWVPLPRHNSTLFLNDTFKIEFNANPDLK